VTDERELEWARRQLDEIGAENIQLSARVTDVQLEADVRLRGFTLLAGLGSTLGRHVELESGLAAALPVIAQGLLVQRALALARTADGYVPFASSGYTPEEAQRLVGRSLQLPADSVEAGLLVTSETPAEDWITAAREALGVPVFGAVGAGGSDVAVLVGRAGLTGAFYLRFGPADVEMLGAAVALIVSAVANARAAAQALRQSRARIVNAGDEQRRKLERDLHDGAQQRLVALAITVQLAQRRAGQLTPPELDGVFEGLAVEAQAALEQLRELAQGLHPQILTEDGLTAALRSLADRSSVPVQIESSLKGRLPTAVEACAYFVCSEALANVSKYAQARSARVSAACAGETLRVEIADDGVGGADLAVGRGLRGLADRVEALGGRFDVISPPGNGTVLTAALPLDAHDHA